MEPLTWKSKVSLLFLMTSSVCVLQCITPAVGVSLPCPQPCKCREYKGNSDKSYSAITMNRIDCEGLGLTAVPDLSLLKGSVVPNYLVLSDNEIGRISKKDFPPGLKIVILSLTSNRDINISTNAFLNLGYSLKRLDINAVDLIFDETLSGFFDSLFSLEFISLEHNNKIGYTKGAVQHVEATLFQGEVAKSLKELHLAFCRLRSLADATLKGLTRLEHLDLSNNWITSIPSTIRHLHNLVYVEFFYCQIKSLDDNDFSGLPKLETIDLSSNSKMETIGDEAFAGCENSLKSLKLHRCGLTEIPTKGLRRLKKLTTLDISENKFVNVGQSPLAGEYQLKRLTISSKNMTFHPEIFTGQEGSIQELSIPRMDLKTVPSEALKTLTNLRHLSLEYNKITHLPKNAFSGLNLSSIRMDNNPLSSIDKGAFDGLPPELGISLRRTEMSDIQFLTGYGNLTIDSVNLGYAKLVCRCSMKESIKILQTIPHVSGTCTNGSNVEHISNSRLGPILDKACEEEGRNNSVKTITTRFDLMVISLAFVLALSGRV